MKVLINLISGQTIPNLIAQKYINPDKVILLYSKGSIKQKEAYKTVCENVYFEEHEIDPYNFENISNLLSHLIQKYKSDEIVINFTCGTKIMSIASFEVFKNKGLVSLYIDSENSRIYVFSGSQIITESINIDITLEEHLKLNGHVYKINSVAILNEEKKEFIDYLENNFNQSIGKFLSSINDKYKLNKEEFYKNEYNLKTDNLSYSWDNKHECSVVEINGKKFVIHGKDSVKYVTGLWFEDLVYYKIFMDNKYYTDVKRNVHIKDRTGKQDMIELDIIGLYKNNFHLFELKSGKPTREALNNLRTIKEQLGTYTKLFLVSYYDLENDPLNERMQDLGIEYYKYSDFTLDKCFKNKNINL